MARFVVRERERTGRSGSEFLVLDTDHDDLPVAQFDTRDAAESHALRLAQGPFDWDEQEAWKDPWDEDDDDEGRP